MARVREHPRKGTSLGGLAWATMPPDRAVLVAVNDLETELLELERGVLWG